MNSKPCSSRTFSDLPSFLTLLAFVAAITSPVHATGATTTRTKAFARPPYYHGTSPPAEARIVHAVAGASATELPEAWIPRKALSRLIADLEELLADGTFSSASAPPIASDKKAVAPVVSFGCALDEIDECHAETRQNVLATTSGTRLWRERLVAGLEAAGADHLLFLEVRLAPQWIHQKNFTGKKEVRLGTDRTQRLDWLTSLDSPVWVLQITGAVVDLEGKVVRSGVEGVWAVRTPFRASILGVERVMTDDDVELVRTQLERDDLPGRPLAWQAAVRQIVRGLTTTAN